VEGSVIGMTLPVNNHQDITPVTTNTAIVCWRNYNWKHSDSI